MAVQAQQEQEKTWLEVVTLSVTLQRTTASNLSHMKRIDLIRHLEKEGCGFFREGSKHTVYMNRAARTSSTIPRHREVNEFLARKICRDLQVPEPSRKSK